MDAETSRELVAPCKCGSPASVDWSACSEIAGKCWQTVTIDCANPDEYGCYRAVRIEVDGDVDDGRAAEQAAITAWNALAGQATGGECSKCGGREVISGPPCDACAPAPQPDAQPTPPADVALTSESGGITSESAADVSRGLPTMEDAIAAGDGTLHGAIDYWQEAASRAFVEGAKWWEWHKTGATMWPSDQQLALEAAPQKLIRLTAGAGNGVDASTVRLLPVPQAFFDEFGHGADDRVQDYARACIAAALGNGGERLRLADPRSGFGYTELLGCGHNGATDETEITARCRCADLGALQGKGR